MRVRFKRQFFGPNAVRYRPDRWHDIPDSWKDHLPTTPSKANKATLVPDYEIDESAPAMEKLPPLLVAAAQAKTAQNAISEMETIRAETTKAKK